MPPCLIGMEACVGAHNPPPAGSDLLVAANSFVTGPYARNLKYDPLTIFAYFPTRVLSHCPRPAAHDSLIPASDTFYRARHVPYAGTCVRILLRLGTFPRRAIIRREMPKAEESSDARPAAYSAHPAR